ncbi:MAG TPA: glycine zipper domain-containing protein [Verrucomicrobiales bacterium]|nr:glycine zipper domain-containing protein [Verrucomicrobiales bacterium]
MKLKTLFLLCGTAVATGLCGCTQTDSTYHTKRGAVGGGVLGAAVGGIIGHQSGRGLEGAAIGGGLGAVGGSVMGNAADEREDELRRSQGQPYPPQR